MVYVKLACLAVIAFLCEASGGQYARAPQAALRRPGPGCALAPRPPRPQLDPQPPPCPPNLNAAYRYERTLEEIIAKLVNALIYTTLQNNNGGGVGGCMCGGAEAGSGNTGPGSGGSGGGGAGGPGGGGLDKLLDSLISLDVGLGGEDLVNVDVLGGGGSGAGSGGGGGTSALSRLNKQQLLNLILLGGNEGAGGSSVGSADNLLNVAAKLGGKNLANVGVL